MFTLSAGFLGGPKSVLISTWDTEKLGGTGSATKVLLLPMTAGNTIDWGDGTINNLNTHTYASGGVKTVKIYGEVTGFRFNNGGDKLKLTDVSDVGGLVIDQNAMFYGCANITWTATNTPLVANSSLISLFRSCTLFNGNISNWNMSLATSLNSSFRDCISFNQDLSGWDTSSNTGLNSSFDGATIFNQDFSGWDVSGVTTMTNMLRNTSFSTTNYDLLLPAWEAQSVQDNVSAHFGSATYGAGTPATARAALIADHTWTITDGGPT